MRNTAISFVWPFCENICLLKSLARCLIRGTYSINKLHPTFTPFYSYVFQQFASFPTQFSSVQSLSPLRPSQPHGLQHARSSCQSPTPRVHSNSCPLNRWCHPKISSSVIPFHPALNLSQHQGLFQWVNSLHQVAKILELQHQSFQWIFRIDFFKDWLVWFPCSPRDPQESSPVPQFKRINSTALSLLYGPTLTSVYDYWKNYSFDYMNLCWQSDVFAFNMLSRLVIVFLPRSKGLLILWCSHLLHWFWSPGK